MGTTKIKLILLLLIIGFASLGSFAEKDSNEKSGSSSNGTAILTCVKNSTGKKRIPSRNTLELLYSDGVLTLNSESCEGVFELSLDNSVTLDYFELHSVAIGESIMINLPYGEYNVTAEDSEGRIYTGTLIL